MENKKKIGFVALLFIVISSTLGFIFTFTLSPVEKIDYNKYYKSGASDYTLANRGYENSSGNEIFWFLHATDTQHIWYNDGKIANWNRFLNESFNVIDPVMIWNTGDLVDSDYENFVSGNERDQRIEEWQRYNQSLNDNNMNSSVYMDVMGNHDVYGDPSRSYSRQYSMMGQSFDALQYSVRKSFSFGNYAFIGLDTPETYGAEYPFGLFGHLNTPKLDWYEAELNKYSDTKKIFIFGHQPPFEIYSGRTTSGKDFFTLNAEHRVFAYLCGHGHESTFQNVNGMFAIETNRFDREGGNYRILAMDNDYLSSSIENVGQWPQGIITYPPQENLINEDITGVAKIRALAWDPKNVTKVEWSAYDLSGATKITEWATLNNVTNDGPLYEGIWDTNLNDGNDYLIKVKITGGSGESIKEIYYSSHKSFFMHLYELIPIFVISFVSLVSIIILITAKRRLREPEYKKRESQNVDKELRNLYLLKWLVFLGVPLSFGGMIVGNITTVFSLFFLDSWGIRISGILFIFFAVIFVVSMIGEGFRLSPETQRHMKISMGFALSLEIFLIIFFILHFPAISWLSPGLYGMVILEFFMLRRSREIDSEWRERLPEKKKKTQ